MLIPFIIIVIHFIADFIFQAEEWAINKSKNNKALTLHVLCYSTVWLLFANAYSVLTGNYLMMCFPVITFICHWITDYYTSRIVSKKFAKGHYGSPIPNFGAFTVIGFDQVLHYGQLFLTFYLLTSK